MNERRFLLAVLASLLVARSAQADNKQGESKEARERAAKRACLNGEAEKGIKLLTDLYVDTNDPTYIFNQGRCYEQGSFYREAIERFREYLRKAQTAKPSERAGAERHIADCKAVLDSQAKEAAPSPREAEIKPPAEVAPLPTPTPAAPVVEAPASVSLQAAPSENKQGGSGLRIAGIAVGVVGAAALAAGIVLNIKHNNTIRDMRKSFDQDTYSKAGDYRTGAIIGYAAGAACLAGGAILTILGWDTGNTVVTPVAGPDHASLALAGRF